MPNIDSECEDQNQKKQRNEDSRTYWHRWLSQLFEALLIPVGISVHTDYQLMSKPPSSDILLMQKKQKGWNEAQRAVLPDGIRNTKANQILIEFKYTESINENVMKQVSCYDYFYKQTQQLKDDEVQTFLLSSKTPRNETLQSFNFELTEKKGVYKSTDWKLKHITLLSLNDLSNQEHNAYLKCFASKKKEREAAFEVLNQKSLSTLDESVHAILLGLKIILFEEGGLNMQFDPATIDLRKIGKKFQENIIANASLEQRLKGLDPEDILKQFKPEDILKRFKPEDILKRFKPEDILKRFKPEERLEGLKPDEIEQIEAYLKKLKAKKVKKAKKNQ